MAHRERRKLSFHVKWTIAARQGFKCSLCGGPLDDTVDFDHSVPLSRGGSDDASNITALHVSCHRRKSTMEAVARNKSRALYCDLCAAFFSPYFLKNHMHLVEGPAGPTGPTGPTGPPKFTSLRGRCGSGASPYCAGA